MHQLLACLHHVGVPTKVTLPYYTPGGPAEQQATANLVTHFRENCRLPHPLPLPPILEEESAAEEPQSEPAPQANKVWLIKTTTMIHHVEVDECRWNLVCLLGSSLWRHKLLIRGQMR